MIIRLTETLATKLHEEWKVVVPSHNRPFLDWHATLFKVERVHYILVMNSTTLYTVIMPGAGIIDTPRFLEQTVATLQAVITADDPFLFPVHISPFLQSIIISKSGNPSALVSMQAVVRGAILLLGERHYSPRKAADALNDRPWKQFGFRTPKELMQLLKQTTPA